MGEQIGAYKKRPVFDGDLCVLARAATAHCDRCANACPAQAILLRENDLGFDEDACISCGLCAPACPESAIHFERQAAQGTIDGEKAAFLACEPMARATRTLERAQQKTDSAGVLACLHNFGLRDLAQLYETGVQRMIVAKPDCTHCQLYRSDVFGKAITLLNTMLASRKVQPLLLEVALYPEWRRKSENAKSRKNFGESAGFARRDLFAIFHHKSAAKTQKRDWLGLPWRDEADIVPFMPQINAHNCVACDACAKVCPHCAISVKKDDGAKSYVLDARACTGCRLCADICEDNAIHIIEPGQAAMQTISLDSHRCAHCGAPFDWPAARAGEAHNISKDDKGAHKKICRICQKIDHKALLHQVLR